MNARKVAAGLLTALAITAIGAPAPTLADSVPSPKIALDNPLAPFLESRAYAAANGATGEFTKMEGSALDPVRKKLYIAISSVSKTMSDGKGDLQLPENKCGAVYVADLDDSWNITSMKPLVVGGPYDSANKENACSTDSISNPDNLFVDAHGNLWIGEDTDYHANNYLWMYDGKQLKRFAAMPKGAEVTGLRITPSGTIFLNTQHPSAMNVYPYNRAVIGVVNHFEAGGQFQSLPVPTGDDQLRLTLAGGSHQILGRMGEPIPGDAKGARFGQRFNADGSSDIANDPDGSMFLPVDSTGSEGYLYTNIEGRPAGISKLYIRQQKNGEWQVMEGENVDQMPIGGSWNYCNASVTPWNTGLTSEEYEPDVTEQWAANVAPMTSYLGRQANPYDYGYLVELSPSELGTKLAKHYTMGRASHENAALTPDQRTAFITDDHDNGVMFKFLADKAGDLSAGTLYAAKMVQVKDGDSYRFDITWVKLGSGNDKDLAAGVKALLTTQNQQQ